MIREGLLTDHRHAYGHIDFLGPQELISAPSNCQAVFVFRIAVRQQRLMERVRRGRGCRRGRRRSCRGRRRGCRGRRRGCRGRRRGCRGRRRSCRGRRRSCRGRRRRRYTRPRRVLPRFEDKYARTHCDCCAYGAHRNDPGQLVGGTKAFYTRQRLLQLQHVGVTIITAQTHAFEQRSLLTGRDVRTQLARRRQRFTVCDEVRCVRRRDARQRVVQRCTEGVLIQSAILLTTPAVLLNGGIP